ncbi:uncharacterized protein BDCG_17038 [Blastomyces dermatitidis ER-3]|uniref:Uncharacterized protein n=1 Tax=Ajellomyces dermatitidis (strain ER-3 / ATCC MYA-2586) TaxID=559297 RepID=A0ABX2VVZ4_AJEDR|nr:uncharacterized protein BDCG_17038 [Blastomyces dermatitidis ER-3]OAT01324.1 hypothetical protein BDCG_17038 [Blastomyces dermatitidis ER-3]
MPVNTRSINREETSENQIAGFFLTSITARRQCNNQAQDNSSEPEDMTDHDKVTILRQLIAQKNEEIH